MSISDYSENKDNINIILSKLRCVTKLICRRKCNLKCFDLVIKIKNKNNSTKHTNKIFKWIWKPEENKINIDINKQILKVEKSIDT